MKLLIRALSEQLFEKESDPTGTVAMLYSETVKFRDKLLEETGQVLTVEDTQTALDALEKYISGEELPQDLTAEQRTLAQIWIDRLTLFR